MGGPFEGPVSLPAAGQSSDIISSIEISFHSRFDYGAVEKNAPVVGEKKTVAQRLFPTGFKREMKELFSLTWPTVLTCLSINIVAPITIMFCGQLGREQLDGVALANSLVNVCGTSVITGMCAACDTLFAQAFGGPKKHLVGVYLQRSIIIISLTCFLSWAVYLNTEYILLLLGQNPSVARIAGDYALFFTPGLLFYVLYQVFVKYLQNQNRVYPSLFVGVIGNVFNAVGHYVVIFVLEYGTRSSAIVQSLTYVVMSMLTLTYIIASGFHKTTWTGWSWRALQNWSGFLTLAIPGVLMTIVEWWSYEIGIFAAGILGEVPLGALTVVFQLQSLNYVLPWGISVACSIRVGQSLGSGSAMAAKTAAVVSFIMAGLFFVVAGCVLMALKDVLPVLFTNDREVQKVSTDMIPVIVGILFLNAITATSGGILRGTGRQIIGAVCNPLGYILLSVPVSLVIMFTTNIGAIGFWFGLASGITPVSIAYLIIIARTDWHRQVEKAAMRANEVENSPVPLETQPLLLDLEKTDLSDNSGNIIRKDSGSATSSHGKDHFLSSRSKFKLLLKTVLICFVMLCIFLSGIIIRLNTELPHSVLNQVTVNSTSVPHILPLANVSTPSTV